MSRQHLLISIAVAVIVIIFATVMFTRNNTSPDVEGASTANDYTEQVELPAGPATVNPPEGSEATTPVAQ